MNNSPCFQNYMDSNFTDLLSRIGRPVIINDNKHLCIEHGGEFMIAGDWAARKIGAAVNFGGANLSIREVRVDSHCVEFSTR